MGFLPRFALTTLTATLVIACGGKQFDSQGSGASGDEDSGTPDAGSAIGGRQGGAGGFSARSGGAGPGGAGLGGAGLGGTVTSSGGQPIGAGGSGAGGSTVLRASDFDQACRFDGECSLVTEGDVCGCPGCPYAAIATSAVDAWNRALGAVVCEGPPQPCPAPVCDEILPACVSGKCAARHALYIDPARYESTCDEDSDCKVIQGGEVCSACKCGGTGVNTGAYTQYLQELEGVACTPGPNFCDCAIFDVAHCESSASGSGTCVAGL